MTMMTREVLVLLTLSQMTHFRLFQTERVCRRQFELFPIQALVFTCLPNKSFENIEEKGEIAHSEQFLLFPQCFQPILRTFCQSQVKMAKLYIDD